MVKSTRTDPQSSLFDLSTATLSVDEDNVEVLVHRLTHQGLERPHQFELSELECEFFRGKTFLKHAVLYTFDNCINQLHVVIGKYAGEGGTLARDISTEESVDDDEPSKTPNYELNYAYTDRHKIHSDVKEIISVLNNFIQEVKIYSHPVCIEEFIRTHNKTTETKQKILDEMKRHIRRIPRLRNVALFYKAHIMTKFIEIDKKTHKKFGEMKDTFVNTTVAQTYFRDWERTRREQNLLILKTEEDKLRSKLPNIEKKMREDCIYHGHMMEFLSELSHDYYEKIDAMMKMYDAEMEIREAQKFQLQKQLDDVRFNKQQLKELYEKRAEEMQTYKKVRLERKGRRMIENRAAKKIQAWWKRESARRKKSKKNKKGTKNQKAKKVKSKI